MQPFVLIIILNYNSYTDTIELVESLKKIDYQNYGYLVVDNNSTDGSIEILRKKINKNNLMMNSSNKGYANGNNRGIEVAIKKKADYALILNPDIRLDKDTLFALVKVLEKDNQIAAVGPRICFRNCRQLIYSDGGRVFPEKGFTVKALNKGKIVSQVEKKDLNSVEYVNGSSILIRLSAIGHIGKFREDFFLYFEETEWCLRALKYGWKICTNPNTRAYHLSSNKGKIYNYYMTRNRLWLSKIEGKYFKRTLLYEVKMAKNILIETMKLWIFESKLKELASPLAKIRGIFDGVFTHPVK